MSDQKFIAARRARGECAVCRVPSDRYRCDACREIEKIKRRDWKDRRTGTTHEQRMAQRWAGRKVSIINRSERS